MDAPQPDYPAKAVVETGFIVIRVPVKALPQAVKAACGMHYISGNWKVTDADAFAKEIVLALNYEEEDGTTPIHRLLDKATEYAIEQGGEGIWDADDPECE